MDSEKEKAILEQLVFQQEILEKVLKTTQSLRRYFLWTLIITIGTILLPLVGAIFAIPWLLDILKSAYVLPSL